MESYNSKSRIIFHLPTKRAIKTIRESSWGLWHGGEQRTGSDDAMGNGGHHLLHHIHLPATSVWFANKNAASLAVEEHWILFYIILFWTKVGRNNFWLYEISIVEWRLHIIDDHAHEPSRAEYSNGGVVVGIPERQSPPLISHFKETAQCSTNCNLWTKNWLNTRFLYD